NFHRRRIKTSCRFLIKRIKSCVYSNKYELFYHESKEGTLHSSAEVTGARQLRGAFSDTEDFLDHGLVSANRCSSRTSSITSWTDNIKPSFTKKLKFQSVLEGEAVELKCKLVACPPPTILWFHNNRSIPKERRRRICSDSKMHMHTTSLVIDSIKEKDSGSYKVMAINTEGSAESTASLLVSLREEQSANYLGFVKRSAKAHESIDTMAEQRKDRKIRVELRCVGSPFDKMSKVHQGRSRSKNSLVRTVYFRSGSHSKEKVSEKESKRLETASERAPSPPLMFDRSERFNDRFSDIYCDRRTGARFSDKFSDRCSDRYSERFSDTESLHNEVRTKLTTLQKAVKQKKRLSICTMSSSEFELESVASESSYADYVERLRVKPASLPDVQHFNRTLDVGESHREFQGKTSSGDPSQPRVRHSFEPQSRTRAIQIMRGELVDTLLEPTERKSGEKYSQSLEGKDVDENQADVRMMQRHSVVADHKVDAEKPEAPYSETTAYPGTAAYTESREHLVTSTREKFLRGSLTPEEKTETVEPYEEESAGESLRAQYEKSLEAERMECEEKLLALRIRKWQQGSRASEEETFHPDTDLPMPSETQYMEPEGHIYTQQEMIEKRAIVETEAMPSSFRKSPRMKARLVDPEFAIASTPKSPKVKARGEVETSLSLPAKSATMDTRLAKTEGEASPMQVQKSPRIKARATEVEAELSPRTKTRAEDVLRETPRPRPERSSPLGLATETVEPYEEESAGESLRAQYERSLEADRMECEEKLLALRIRKWQQGMQISEEETFHPETDLPLVAETQFMAPEGNVYTQQEVGEKRESHATTSTPKSPKVKSRVEQDEITVMLSQKSPRIKARAEEEKAESSPRTKPRTEKMLFEKTREERELQLSRENISELKNESEKFVSEEEALTQRIMKWQQDVLMEQEQAVKLESDWVEGYSPLQAERTSEVGRNVAEASALESIPQNEVVRSRKTSPGKTAKEKFLSSESVPAGFQDQQGETLQWPPAGELPTEGRETRLQRDSEYFVSEEEALAQRILKWQQDVVEQEEVAELESEWALDSQSKQSGSRLPFETISPFDSEPYHGGISHEIDPTDPRSPHTSLAGEALPTKKPSPPAAGCEPSPHESSFITRYSPTHPALPHHAGAPVERSYDLKTTPLKDTMGLEASPVQRYSPTQFTSAPQGESPHKPSQEFSSVRRRSPCRRPQESVEKATERRWSREEYSMSADKSSSQRFQSDMRGERGMREELGSTRETSEWRQQKGFAGVRREERHEDLLRSQQGDEMSAEIHELGATRKKEDRVQEESNFKEGVYQSQESKTVKEGVTSARGSRPVFVKEMSSVKVKIGEMSEFTCQFNGDPLPTVTWLKDGHPLAHNFDYDIISKSNKSTLTIFYPTTDHEGTYDCVITNKHGKSICTATLEISDKKVVRRTGATQEVVVTEEIDKGEENQESLMEEELQSYMESGKATLQVPQAVIHRRHCSDESFSSSAVEIRITAPTPVPEMTEENTDDKPQAFTENPSGVPSDEGASQTVKHKFTFSFDVVGEAPHVISELENITCSEDNTAVLECVITGEPAAEVEWYCNDIRLELTGGKYRVEVDDKVYRLYINSFTYTDAGVYKCVARNRLGEVTSISDVSFQVEEPVQFSKRGGVVEDDVFHKAGITYTKSLPQAPSEVAAKAIKSRPSVSREPPALSGCGLQASAAVIKVSKIKQAFESDSPVALMTPTSPEEQRIETFFPEEFIPVVASSPDTQEQIIAPKPLPDGTQTIPVGSKSVSSKTSQFTSPREEGSDICVVPCDVEEGAVFEESHSAVKQFVEDVKESPELVRPKPQKPVCLPVQGEAGEGEMVREGTVPTQFDRSSSFIQFQSEKVPAVKRSVRTSALAEEVVKPKRISESFKPDKQSAPARPEIVSGASVVEGLTEVEKQDVKGSTEGYALMSGLQHMSDELELAGEELISIPELSLDKHARSEQISIPEPSLDSGVFLSMPDSQADVIKVAEGMVADDVVDPHIQIMGEDGHVKAEHKPLIVKPKVDMVGRIKPLSLPVDAVVQGQERRSSDRASAAEAGVAAAAVSPMEEEEVTFSAVYDYYNPPTDWGRPLSPESEMSIEIGSTLSEEIAEVAERFYTPGSSTEVSQPIAESFHTPKSPMSFHTPSSDAPGGFMTPQEYPFSPVEHQRPSTGISSERFFSPLQFLTSPADEGIETTPLGINVDENQFLTRGRGSTGLQEKVQGIPPAFLKPLIKKRVFENDSLTFCAEVFGLPSPDVKWFCNKTQLVADDRVKMERDGDTISLTIHNVTKADQGEYICEAVNYVGEARSVALVVVVSQEVRFMPAPPAVTHQHVMEFDVEEDDSSRSPSPQEILLEVELDENEVKEFEKQVKIITIPEYTADNKSMIISLDVLPSIYEEGAVDFVTQEHDELKIAFEVTEMPPRFINPICDMEAPEGTTVMFECSLMGIPSPIVSWFKGDKKVPHNNKKYLHSSDGDNHFLKICKVSTQDSGVYTCRAINVVGETLCRASVVVLSAKTFSGKTRGRELTAVSLGSAKVQPQKFDLMVGNTSFDGEQVSEIELEFEFEQEADESQRAVRLVANTDNEMSEQGEKYVSINFDVFAEPAKDDKVEFKGKSSDMCSFQFQVTETAPKCVIPLTNVTAAVGTPVILQCLVSGKPNPTAEWYKDGDRVADSRCIIQEKTTGHFNLLITNVTQSDAGEYKCIIQNTAGCVETTALLKVF
ncbi:titin homolog, partial [Seriola lalandi dorsalis]|uniref:titin homolog n=1 Tax=Seriola lalandi dorsalis TaxID=1841481 RepID=UPI000C6F984D